MAVPIPDWANSRVHYSGGIFEVRYSQTISPGYKVWTRSGGTYTITATNHGMLNGATVFCENFYNPGVSGSAGGTTCPWTRSGTTYTFTLAGHGLVAGRRISIDTWVNGAGQSVTGPRAQWYELTGATTDTFTITAIEATRDALPVLSGSARTLPGVCQHTIFGVTTNSFQIATGHASLTSGRVLVVSPGTCPKIKINGGSEINCLHWIYWGASLIVRIPTGNFVQAGNTVQIWLPAGMVDEYGSNPSAEVPWSPSPKYLTNGVGVEILSDEIPEDASEMMLGNATLNAEYWGNNHKETDFLRIFNYEICSNRTHAIWLPTARNILVDPATGLPTSVPSWPISTVAFQCTGLPYATRPGHLYPLGRYTVRWKGTGPASLNGRAVGSPAVYPGDGFTYQCFDFDEANKATQLNLSLSGYVTDLQVIAPGFSVNGGPATQILHQDWIDKNAAFDALRMMAYVQANRCNCSRWSHLPASTWKFDQGFIVPKTGLITAVTDITDTLTAAMYFRPHADELPDPETEYLIYEITHTVGDELDTGVNVTISGLVGEYMIVRTAANKFIMTADPRTPPTVGATITATLQVDGPPLSRIVELCNRSGKHLYYNVPHAMRDADITLIANYIRDNLNGNLDVYLELSNEMWNSAFPDQWQFIKTGAFSDPVIGWPCHWTRSGTGPYTITVTFDNHTCNYSASYPYAICCGFANPVLDGERTIANITGAGFTFTLATDPGASGTCRTKNWHRDYLTMALQWYGKRSAQVHKIFKDSFGARTLHRVICGQAVNYSTYHTYMIGGYHDHCVRESPGFLWPTYYGFAAYIGWQCANPGRRRGVDFVTDGVLNFNLLTPDQYLDSIYATLHHHRTLRIEGNCNNLAINFPDVKPLVYEAGMCHGFPDDLLIQPGYDGPWYTAQNRVDAWDLMNAIKRHPRSTLLTLYSLQQSHLNGVELYCNFTDYSRWAESGVWGSCDLSWITIGPGDGTFGGWDNRDDLEDPENQAVVCYAYDRWAGAPQPPEPPQPPATHGRVKLIKRRRR